MISEHGIFTLVPSLSPVDLYFIFEKSSLTKWIFSLFWTWFLQTKNPVCLAWFFKNQVQINWGLGREIIVLSPLVELSFNTGNVLPLITKLLLNWDMREKFVLCFWPSADLLPENSNFILIFAKIRKSKSYFQITSSYRYVKFCFFYTKSNLILLNYSIKKPVKLQCYKIFFDCCCRKTFLTPSIRQ